MYLILIVCAALIASGCSDEHVEESVQAPTDGESASWSPSRTNQDEPSSSPVASSTGAGTLTPAQVLNRASIDIRGRRPSRDEFNRLATSPERLDEMLDEFLDDPGFPDSVADLFSRALRNRSDSYQGVDDEAGPGQTSTYQQSAADEPLMLIRHIVKNELSYDEFLEADYTFANHDLASLWHMTGYDAQTGGWQRVRYADDRPAAGFLSQTSPFLRFVNNDGNFNRGRANAMSRILLCSDFLKIPVDFPRDLDLSDENAIDNAISTNVACTSCHTQLDPIASFFSVYPEPDADNGEVGIRYRPDNAEDWIENTGKRPAFYGREGNDLADLARFIREDSRYLRCAVSRVYEGLLDRPATSDDSAAITQHLEAFEEGGRTFTALYRSVLSDPLYRGRNQDARSATGAKMLSPELLQRVVTHLTGFHAKIEGVDIMRHEEGLRILGGGLSAFSGDYPSRTANVTRVLVHGRLAEAAALYVVTQSNAQAETLVADMDVAPSSSDIERLFQTILGRGPTPQDLSDFNELFEMIQDESGDFQLAHAALISVLLRDPEFIIY